MNEAEVQVLIEIIGWTGSAAILLAYGMNSYQKISSASLLFAVLNFAGGALLIVYTIYKDAYANTFINGVWLVIATVSLVRYFRNTKRGAP